MAFIAIILQIRSTVRGRVAANRIAATIPLCAGHGGLDSGRAVGPNPHNHFSTIGAKQGLELYKRRTYTKKCRPSRHTTTGKLSKEGPYITPEKKKRTGNRSKYAPFASRETIPPRVYYSQRRRTRAGASPGQNKMCCTRVSRAPYRVPTQQSLTCRHGSMARHMPSISRR